MYYLFKMDNIKIELNFEHKNSVSSVASTTSELSIINLVQNFKEFLEETRDDNNSLPDNSDLKGNLINAYIKTISTFIENSQETTLQGLNIAIKKATEYLFRKIKDEDILPKGRSILTLKAVGEIIINMLNKHISKKIREDFSQIKQNLVTITKDLYLLSTYAKEKISNFFDWVIKNGNTILVHGYSSTILYALLKSKKNGLNFKVLITESRPENSGEIMAKALVENGIEAKVILDISIGYYIKDIDFVVLGSDAVCENGGIINKIGTFTIALCAKNFKKPFYVMVESLKFLKMYPLDQYDIPQTLQKFKKDTIEMDYNLCDYTPPEFITLLFTDIGIFTPSAVSDELIQMFYN
jgi:translation initiation factor eIF-2B subunit alpha